jgi:AP-1 complex subunit sigma 1/2
VWLKIKVCELDIIFNFEKALFVWNEVVVGGELTEVSRREVLNAILDQDDIQAVIMRL